MEMNSINNPKTYRKDVVESLGIKLDEPSFGDVVAILYNGDFYYCPHIANQEALDRINKIHWKSAVFYKVPSHFL